MNDKQQAQIYSGCDLLKAALALSHFIFYRRAIALFVWMRAQLFLLIGDLLKAAALRYRTLVVAQLSRIQKSFLFIQKERL